MEKSVAILRVLLAISLSALAPAAQAQDGPPQLPQPGGYGAGQRAPMSDWRDLSPEQHEQRREERRQQREARRQMSPEERHQFRSDIRDAGRSIYHPQGQGRQRR